MHLIFLWVSIGSALLLATFQSEFEPYDRSVLSLLLSLGVSAVVLVAVHFQNPSFSSRGNEQHNINIPFTEPRLSPSEAPKQPTVTDSRRIGPRSQFRLLLLAILALAIRIELYRKISATAQCASRGWVFIIPLVLAINEYRYQQPFQRIPDKAQNRDLPTGLGSGIKSYLLRPPWRYVPSAFILCCGCYGITALWIAQGSTYICPTASGGSTWTPRFQQLTTAIDCSLAVMVQEIARSNNSYRHRIFSLPLSFAVILFGAVVCWMGYGVVIYFTQREEFQWFISNDTPPAYNSVWSSISHALVSALFVTSSIYCISHCGIYHLSVALATSVTLFLGIRKLWSFEDAFPPAASNASIWSFIAIFIGAWTSYRVRQAIEHIPHPRSVLQIACFLVLLVAVIPGFWVTNSLHFHPIELLMFDAKTKHEQYIKYASQSTDLQSAVAIYRERYHTNPPPGFDKWYEYARNRSVLVIDEYDQMHRDLLPFRAVPPADIRRYTWEIVSNQWNEISGLKIRNGKAELLENFLPTHRWMLEGVAAMINTFASHLPDMDLAFNLNDESRVAVPFTIISSLGRQANQVKFGHLSNWSSDRATTWLPVANEQYPKTVFENFSFKKTFGRFGTIGCPPESLSITHPFYSSQSKLCLACLKPHSIGQFVSNWTLAADMCHQPDMSRLHGFHLSPAAFKTTHHLLPVFSQSKASGYNDILYPSSWNYMDKVRYEPINATGEYGTDTYSAGYPDPPFSEKKNILYWRGTTSEGVSAGINLWQGMNRQRLVHLTNNATSNRDHDRTTILLSNPTSPEEYTYHSLPGTALQPLGLLQSADIRFADTIARCGGKDCANQELEFGLVPPVSFQSHWRYRFLFDMDGAGFSGRFLPFLQSRSLPFKTALFREWYNSRITAWRHFVPIDMRLHGVWSTLAYFAGVDGVWPATGDRYTWKPHVEEAETIAEEGRKWSGTVLRKEDMEVYFFRLLLEWGRLTDDRRDELGFVME